MPIAESAAFWESYERLIAAGREYLTRHPKLLASIASANFLILDPNTGNHVVHADMGTALDRFEATYPGVQAYIGVT